MHQVEVSDVEKSREEEEKVWAAEDMRCGCFTGVQLETKKCKSFQPCIAIDIPQLKAKFVIKSNRIATFDGKYLVAQR